MFELVFNVLFTEYVHLFLIITYAFLMSICLKSPPDTDNSSKSKTKLRRPNFFPSFGSDDVLLPNEIHKPINEAAAEGLIVDPKNVKFIKNIDKKPTKLNNFENELSRMSTEDVVSNSDDSSIITKRVKIRESKCKLFETSDVKTEDSESSVRTCRI